MGLMPMPESARMSHPKRSAKKSMASRASSEPSASSMPAYTSSVFSRKITMSTFDGSDTGLGTPWYQRTGLRHTYRSRIWRRATLRLRKPSPTGVVSGPLMPMRWLRKASTVSSGSHSPVSS